MINKLVAVNKLACQSKSQILIHLALAATAVSAHATWAEDLTIAEGGTSRAVIAVSPQAGTYERMAAEDLAKYVEIMSGAKLALADSAVSIQRVLREPTPVFIVGRLALEYQPDLQAKIDQVLKKNPHLRTDGIALKRIGQRVYLAGNNDFSHYFAVAELLRRWGCRWYIPTEFGECIPERPVLKIGSLDHVYSSPFEIRSYWISWLGDNSGEKEFQLRNMMTGRGDMPTTGHALGKYTKGLSEDPFDFPITDPATAKHVVEQVEQMYAQGESFSLGMEDGPYRSDDPRDQKLLKLQWDKYFMSWSVTDPMLELYNNVARMLRETYPQSHSRIGFLAYANMTLPPVRDMRAEESLFCELAPIDIDPIHGMDDRRSPARQEYRDMMYRWAKVMQGRLCIYDYDQSMMVWRDIPNPSHMSFRHDIQHYRKAGILGVNTESRNAIATTFINLYLRARLLWNPDEDVNALLADFYPNFYGPAAEPMEKYWSTIYAAWENTICTEHEYFIAPAIYTPQVIESLRESLLEAEQIVNGLRVQGRPLSRNEQRYIQRMKFTRLGFDVLSGYLSMVRSASQDCDFAAAVAAGETALARREELTEMSGIFTTYRRYQVEQNGYSWWPGEVKHYRELIPLIDGTHGELVQKLPIEWGFRRTVEDDGLKRGFATQPIDLNYWNAHKHQLTLDNRKDYPDRWEQLRTDLYAQAQGILHPDWQSYRGYLWYRADVDLTETETKGKLRLHFPGIFNDCWIYVNGELVGQRSQETLWWRNDYRFQWDINLEGKLHTGKNVIAVCCHCQHHYGGIFRRPFLYRAHGQ